MLVFSILIPVVFEYKSWDPDGLRVCTTRTTDGNCLLSGDTSRRIRRHPLDFDIPEIIQEGNEDVIQF